MAHPVVHFEIGCKDSAKTAAFYKSLFGWEIDKQGPAAMIATGVEHGIQGHISALGHEPHNYVLVYALVDNLEEAVAKAESLGGATLVPPQEVPGMGRFAWIGDVEGTPFGLWEPKEA